MSKEKCPARQPSDQVAKLLIYVAACQVSFIFLREVIKSPLRNVGNMFLPPRRSTPVCSARHHVAFTHFKPKLPLCSEYRSRATGPEWQQSFGQINDKAICNEILKPTIKRKGCGRGGSHSGKWARKHQHNTYSLCRWSRRGRTPIPISIPIRTRVWPPRA